MKKTLFILFFLLITLHVTAFGKPTRWTAAGGFGLMVSPTLILINPQLEIKHSSQVYYGPMIQMGLGDGGILFTVSGTYRYVLRTRAKIKPCFEGGLGLAVASALYSDSVGVHISMGMGFDYVIDANISLGTMIRANFAPPLKTFFLSWPILVARLAL